VTSVREQRAAAARAYLTKPVASKVGEFAYSNLGYIIAGAIAEARTGKSWEQLIRELVFEPLGIRNAGFGAPGRSGRFDEPYGHEEVTGRLVPLDPANVELVVTNAGNASANKAAQEIGKALRDRLEPFE
jgi:CubicO group peptidase (beta-lactamase class C family)